MNKPRTFGIWGNSQKPEFWEYLPLIMTWAESSSLDVFLTTHIVERLEDKRQYTYHIIESAEKHETHLLDLDTLTENILTQNKTTDVTITDAKGNPIKGINIIHGYITNINEDRIDIKEIGHSYARRWSVEHAFNRLDNKMRRFTSQTVKVLPNFRKRIITQVVLINKMRGKNSK